MNRPKTDERIIQRRTRRILLAGGGLFYTLLQNILNSATDSRIIMASEEYRRNIRRLVEGDVQILQTLGSFLDEAELSEEDVFAEKMYDANRKNDFLGMAFFGSGMELLVTAENGIEERTGFDTLPEPMQDALERAGEGKITGSDVYDSENMGEDMFVVCVPVMMDGRIRGVLAAGDSAARMRRLFSADSAGEDYSYVHLVNGNGEFQIRSWEGKLPENVNSVFDNPYLEEEIRESMKAVMQNGESGMYMFQVHGTKYKVYLEPVGINDWYLFCVNSMKEVVGSVYWVITGAEAVFLIFLALCLLFIMSSYGLVRHNNRQLLQAACTEAAIWQGF